MGSLSKISNIYIYIYSLSADLDFLLIHWWVWFLTSFSFFPSPISTWSPGFRVLKDFLSPFNVQNSPFKPTFHWPSATGVWATVRYFHLALQSKPGNIFLPCTYSDWQHFWVSRFVLALSHIPFEPKDAQRPIHTTARSYHVWVALNSCLTYRSEHD